MAPSVLKPKPVAQASPSPLAIYCQSKDIAADPNAVFAGRPQDDKLLQIKSNLKDNQSIVPLQNEGGYVNQVPASAKMEPNGGPQSKKVCLDQLQFLLDKHKLLKKDGGPQGPIDLAIFERDKHNLGS